MILYEHTTKSSVDRWMLSNFNIMMNEFAKKNEYN